MHAAYYLSRRNLDKILDNNQKEKKIRIKIGQRKSCAGRELARGVWSKRKPS